MIFPQRIMGKAVRNKSASAHKNRLFFLSSGFFACLRFEQMGRSARYKRNYRVKISGKQIKQMN